MEIPLIFDLCHYLWCRRGNNHFDVHFRRIGPVHFLSKDGKDAVSKARYGRKDICFWLAYFICTYYNESTFPYFVPQLGV